MFNHFTEAGIKAEPRIASCLVIPLVEPNRLESPLLRTNPAEINYPPGIIPATPVAKSYIPSIV
jgi:hypothetical protein